MCSICMKIWFPSIRSEHLDWAHAECRLQKPEANVRVERVEGESDSSTRNQKREFCRRSASGRAYRFVSSSRWTLCWFRRIQRARGNTFRSISSDVSRKYSRTRCDTRYPGAFACTNAFVTSTWREERFVKGARLSLRNGGRISRRYSYHLPSAHTLACVRCVCGWMSITSNHVYLIIN